MAIEFLIEIAILIGEAASRQKPAARISPFEKIGQ